MAVRRRPDTHSPIYFYDFYVGGVRYRGSTLTADEAQARQVEKVRRAEFRAAQRNGVGFRPRPTIPLEDALAGAIEVTASVYGLSPTELGCASRGRGPRPPMATWEARKMAVFLTVVLSGCDYATLARLMGLHKDTVASHCADMREACIHSDRLEDLSGMLEQAIRARLAMNPSRATAVRSAA